MSIKDGDGVTYRILGEDGVTYRVLPEYTDEHLAKGGERADPYGKQCRSLAQIPIEWRQTVWVLAYTAAGGIHGELLGVRQHEIDAMVTKFAQGWRPEQHLESVATIEEVERS